jgi:tetratricopeptide (TPR) repeat protein
MAGVLRSGLLLVVLLAAGAPGRAGAQARGGEDEYARTIREAIAEAAAAHWEEARALFERAHALEPSARTLRGLGIAAFELRHYVQSLRELEAALAERRNPLTPAQRQEVNDAIARARRYVGTVTVLVKPADAKLYLDGAEISRRELQLDVGDYRLTARADGYRDAERRVRVAGGQAQRVAIELARADLSVSDSAAGAAQPAGDAFAQGAPEPRDDANLLEQWWFWTAVGVVAVGGAATAIVLTREDAAEPEQGIGGRIAVLTVAP